MYFGETVIVPTALRREVLTELHRCHPGIVRTNSQVRSHVWWSNIDTDIEDMCQSCPDRQHYLPKPEYAPVHLWEWTDCPWERIHVDFAGPFKGHKYFIAFKVAGSCVHVINNI